MIGKNTSLYLSLHACIKHSSLIFLNNLNFTKIDTIENFPNIGR